MRLLLSTPNATTTTFGPLIAAGLATLIAHAYWPVVPVTTSLALIALGTTTETIRRSRRTADRCGVIPVHLVVYMSLYLFFVGAIYDASMRGPRNGLAFLQSVDLVVSAGIMILVAKLCVSAIFTRNDATIR